MVTKPTPGATGWNVAVDEVIDIANSVADLPTRVAALEAGGGDVTEAELAAGLATKAAAVHNHAEFITQDNGDNRYILQTNANAFAPADSTTTALAGKQPLDADLTALAGLDSATAGTVASDGAGWVKKTYAQLKTALGLVKGDVGLGNVDNTSDANKPVSTATQTALAAKQPAVRDLARSDTLTLARLAGNPVLTQAAQNPGTGAASPTTAASLYWPWVVDARAALGGAALDEWYLYYSTDHDATGGIWLATAPAPTGPWTGRGRVYLDTVSGTSSETPSVVWNPGESLFFMYYQQAGVAGANGVQSTLLATSPDGVAWTRVGVVVDIPAGNKVPGDGHTGYFRPFRVGRQWFAHHLYGGGNYPHYALSTSQDGRTWSVDPRLLRYGADQFDDSLDFQIAWNSGNVVNWHGQLWWIGLGTDFTSGGGTKTGRVMAAPLSRDLRTLVGKPVPVLYPTVGANESTNYRSTYAFVDHADRLVLLYQCDNNFNAAVGA